MKMQLNTPGTREKALSIIPHITGALSIVGSTFIVFQILLSKQKRSKTYHKLLLCMSSCDIVSSIGYFMSTWPLPEGTINLPWKMTHHYAASGNNATCTAQAAFIQFGIGAVFYNVALSVYFVLIVNYNLPDHILKKWFVEPILIAIPLLVAIALVIPGFFNGMYGNAMLWCWIAPKFDLCTPLKNPMERQECFLEAKQEAYKNRWLFCYSWVFGAVALTLIAQCIMFFKVKHLEKRASRWRMSSVLSSRTRDITATTNKSNGTGSLQLQHREEEESPSSTAVVSCTLNNYDTSSVRSTTYIRDNTSSLSVLPEEPVSFTPDEKQEVTTEEEEQQQRRERKQREQQQQQIQNLKKEERRVSYKQSRRIARQSALFFGAFVLTWVPYSLTIFFVNKKHTTILYAVVILQPLQGFMNCFIYNRKSIRKGLIQVLSTLAARVRSSISSNNGQEGDNDSNKAPSQYNIRSSPSGGKSKNDNSKASDQLTSLNSESDRHVTATKQTVDMP